MLTFKNGDTLLGEPIMHDMIKEGKLKLDIHLGKFGQCI